MKATIGSVVVEGNADEVAQLAQFARLMQANVPNGLLPAGHPRARPGEAAGVIVDLLRGGRKLCTRELVRELLALGHKIADTTLDSALTTLRRDGVLDRTPNSGGKPGENGRWFLVVGGGGDATAGNLILTVMRRSPERWTIRQLVDELAPIPYRTVANALQRLKKARKVQSGSGSGRDKGWVIAPTRLKLVS